jgi:hypothetical protein
MESAEESPSLVVVQFGFPQVHQRKITEISLAHPDEPLQIEATAKDEVGNLEETRFNQSYKDYLLSPLWRKIKRRVLKRDGKVCLRCGGKATKVHHRSYAVEVKAGNDDEKLASICDGCHHFIHRDNAGKMRNPDETDRTLLLRDESTTFPAPEVDLRLRCRKDPLGWERMSAVQREAWSREYGRLQLLHWIRVGREAVGARRQLHSLHGMDDHSIDRAVSELRKQKQKQKKRMPSGSL